MAYVVYATAKWKMGVVWVTDMFPCHRTEGLQFHERFANRSVLDEEILEMVFGLFRWKIFPEIDDEAIANVHREEILEVLRTLDDVA